MLQISDNYISKPCNARTKRPTELLGIEGVTGISLLYCRRVRSSILWVSMDNYNQEIKEKMSFIYKYLKNKESNRFTKLPEVVYELVKVPEPVFRPCLTLYYYSKQ